MGIAVCIITCQRPQGLVRLLEGLSRLTFARHPADLTCVVVDNDQTQSAREACDAVRPKFRWKLEYHVEPKRGIPFARNTAIRRAGGDADLLAFIDDDEVPEPGWLSELLRVMEECNADVVAGPVVPHFVETPPAWVIKGRFFDRRRWATGTRLDRAFTGNILFQRRVFDGMDTHFDERMAMSGGSDSHFLQRVNKKGFKIVWADEAVATEWVPSSRARGRWILRRAFRIGTTSAFIELDMRPLGTALLRVFASAGLHFARGLVLLLSGFVLGKRGFVRGGRSMCYGVGLLLGLVGWRHREYHKTHGV